MKKVWKYTQIIFVILNEDFAKAAVNFLWRHWHDWHTNYKTRLGCDIWLWRTDSEKTETLSAAHLHPSFHHERLARNNRWEGLKPRFVPKRMTFTAVFIAMDKSWEGTQTKVTVTPYRIDRNLLDSQRLQCFVQLQSRALHIKYIHKISFVHSRDSYTIDDDRYARRRKNILCTKIQKETKRGKVLAHSKHTHVGKQSAYHMAQIRRSHHRRCRFPKMGLASFASFGNRGWHRSNERRKHVAR